MVTPEGEHKTNYSIYDILKEAAKRLASVGIDNAYSEAVILLCAVLSCNKEFVYTHSQIKLSDYQIREFEYYVKSRCEKKPVSYIISSKDFMGLDFHVNESVLIPRPETEILAEYIIDVAKKRYEYGKNKVRVLDIGTGSGCIGISIACMVPEVHVWCADISTEALDMARLNAKKHGVEGKVHFIQSDIFSNIEGLVFDIIVSNPPYIPSDDIQKLDPDVRIYEPLRALDGGKDGLVFYRSIISNAHRFLTCKGVLAFEVGIGQAYHVSELLNNFCYKVEIIKDLSGIDRVVAGILYK